MEVAKSNEPMFQKLNIA